MEERTRVQAALVGLLAEAMPDQKAGETPRFPIVIIQGDVHIGELRIEVPRRCDSEPSPA